MVNKRIRKSVFSILLVIACLFLLSTISHAASFSASISKTTVTVGDTFTVTVNASNAAGMYSISNSNSNVSVASGSKSEFLENGKAIVTFKAVKAGTVIITAEADDMTDLDDDTKTVKGSKSFTVTIKGKDSSSSGSSNNNSGSSNSKPTKPTFQSRNETVYATGDVNVRTSYSTSSSVITTLHKGDSVTRTGRATEYINGVLWSKVTYNGQTAYMSSDLLTTTKPVADKKNEDKKEIAKYYGVGYPYLENWVEHLAVVRNVCAHYGRLYNVNLTSRPQLYRQYTERKITNYRVFATFICLKHLLPNDEHWNSFIVKVSMLIDKFPCANPAYMGFPKKDWEKLLALPISQFHLLYE